MTQTIPDWWATLCFLIYVAGIITYFVLMIKKKISWKVIIPAFAGTAIALAFFVSMATKFMLDFNLF